MHRMNVQISRCPHITVVGNYTKEDIIKKKEISKCDSCENKGPFLWVCLHKDCLYTACGESSINHRLRHFEEASEHCLYLNLTTLRVFCLLCGCEVFLESNEPPLPGMITTHHKLNKMQTQDSESEDDPELGDENLKPRGLTGLQNLGNTCYMNSAIQALSNCPQLSYFFLDCEAFVRSEKKPGLSKSYMRLIREMWHKRRPSYVVPSGIAYGIKMVFPVFRGFMQQDAQEFLRCFMDQLHEELKETVVEIPGVSSPSSESHNEYETCPAEAAIGISEDSSQSDAEFETCDSGLSSEKSSCMGDSGDLPETFYFQDESMKSSFHTGSSLCSEHQSFQGRPKISEMDKEMKESSNFAQRQALVAAEGGSPIRGGGSGSDSGVPYSHSMDSADSVSDRKSPAGTICSYESYSSDCAKCNHSNFTGKQCISQMQRQNVSPHNIIGSYSSTRRKKPVQYRSIISDTFDGKILSSVQCLTCDTVSTTKETFQDLSLPIPTRDHLHMLHASQGNQQKGAGGATCTDVYSHQGWLSWLFGWMFSWFWGPAVSLQDCLAAFFSADELKGDNMYSCEKCKKLRNGIKFSKVLELPEVLCIHLKRFRHEVMFSSKIGSYVSFPLEELDMSPFLHKSCPSAVTNYDLAAVICHHGTAGSGHYTAYALNCLNDQWYEFDDQYVTAVDAQTVQNCEAYVLFYRKSTEEIMKKRLRAVELLERSQNEQGLLQFHISKQWINKFNNFAEPGPITNTDFLCIHGGVPPHRAQYVEDLCTFLPQAVWEYLHDTFGGGPSCTHLYICPICQSEQDALNQRRKTEHDTFVMMNSEFQNQDKTPVVYAISAAWFKLWENFVRGKDNEPPGPIENSLICYIKGNQPVIKLGSDYVSLSEDMWRYLHGIYGGGPEILIQQQSVGSSWESSSTHSCNQPPSSVSSVSRSLPSLPTGSPSQQSNRASQPSSNVEKANSFSQSLNTSSAGNTLKNTKDKRTRRSKADVEAPETEKKDEVKSLDEDVVMTTHV